MTQKPLFDLAEYLPAHVVKKRQKKAKGSKYALKTTAWNATFSEPTKVVRIPVSWERDVLLDRIESMQSALYTAEAELEAAFERGGKQFSNRFEKLAALVAELRAYWPAGDIYDPFKED